jgi:hypothetical protein
MLMFLSQFPNMMCIKHQSHDSICVNGFKYTCMNEFCMEKRKFNRSEKE